MPLPPRDLPAGQTRNDERGVVNIGGRAHTTTSPNRMSSPVDASYSRPKIGRASRG